METTFLGHTAEYWLELNRRPKELRLEDLLQEIVILKGQLEFVKSRIKDINIIIRD